MKLLPDSIKHFIINRLLEISGITSIIISLFILISVISYSNFDPNILNLSSYEIQNLGGQIGANVSELLLQVFGYNSFLICIILFSWSYKLFFSKNLELFALNFLLLPVAVLLLSLFFEMMHLPIANGFIAERSLAFLNETNLIINNYIYYSVVFLFFILLYNY